MNGLGYYSNNTDSIKRRIRACDYLVVAQLFLKDNFLMQRTLTHDDIKPRLLGHWGTCHGINVTYANLKYFYDQLGREFSFVLGPGHGFPALQANLFVDGELLKIDEKATRNEAGIAYICKNFSWPGGFPSHASPVTPGVICEGGELGYSLGTAYGASLGHPEKTIAVLIGDGEFETATALSSMNLVKLMGSIANGKVIPILHLNGYKISAPTIYGRKSERELGELIRGFGYTPIFVDGTRSDSMQSALAQAEEVFAKVHDGIREAPFIIYKSRKGDSGPEFVGKDKVADNFLAHQIPLKEVKTDDEQLVILDHWLKSYQFGDLFNATEGFKL